LAATAQLVSAGVNVMMSQRRVGSWVFVCMALGQAACTSMRPVELAGDGSLPAAIEAGDRIAIVDSGGTTTELVVTTVGADFIEGLGHDDQPIRVATAAISELHERRGAPGKSVGLGFGVALALFVQALSNGAVGGW
jgi:hypothetical protein